MRKHLSEPWFSLVYTGKKTYEGRLFKGDFASTKIGDEIVFYNDDFGINRESKKTVCKIKKFSSFKNMLEKCSLKKVLPTVQSINDGVKIYRKYYDKNSEKMFGIVAIKLC